MNTKFHATINAEGPSATLRGKIPSGLINALGGAQGDMIEFEVEQNGKHTTLIGGRIVRQGTREYSTAQDNIHRQSRVARGAGKPQEKSFVRLPKAQDERTTRKPVTPFPTPVRGKGIQKRPLKKAVAPVAPVNSSPKPKLAPKRSAAPAPVANTARKATAQVAQVKGSKAKTSVVYEIPRPQLKVKPKLKPRR